MSLCYRCVARGYCSLIQVLGHCNALTGSGISISDSMFHHCIVWKQKFDGFLIFWMLACTRSDRAYRIRNRRVALESMLTLLC